MKGRVFSSARLGALELRNRVVRAIIRDPDFVKRLERGEVETSDCDQCNRCIASMDAGGVFCVSRKEGLLDWKKGNHR